MRREAEPPPVTVRRLLMTAILDPAAVLRFAPRELDLMLRLVRRARLLGRLAAELGQRGLLDALPVTAAEQLKSATIAVEARCRVTRWELDRIAWALSRSLPNTPVMVLKGCAYLLAGLPNDTGRVFADVDLLVREQDLD